MGQESATPSLVERLRTQTSRTPGTHTGPTNSHRQMWTTHTPQDPQKGSTLRRLVRRQLLKKSVRLQRRAIPGKPLGPLPILSVGIMIATLGMCFLLDGMVIEDHKFDRRRLGSNDADLGLFANWPHPQETSVSNLNIGNERVILGAPGTNLRAMRAQLRRQIKQEDELKQLEKKCSRWVNLTQVNPDVPKVGDLPSSDALLFAKNDQSMMTSKRITDIELGYTRKEENNKYRKTVRFSAALRFTLDTEVKHIITMEKRLSWVLNTLTLTHEPPCDQPTSNCKPGQLARAVETRRKRGGEPILYLKHLKKAGAVAQTGQTDSKLCKQCSGTGWLAPVKTSVLALDSRSSDEKVSYFMKFTGENADALAGMLHTALMTVTKGWLDPDCTGMI